MTTAKEQIMQFLSRSEYGLCDDCLSEKLGITPRQQINQRARELQAEGRIHRSGSLCSSCHRHKTVNSVVRKGRIEIALPLPEHGDEEEEDIESFTFGFERNLEDHLVHSLGDIEDGLTIFTSDDGGTGRQFSTGVGQIDILAVDSNGDLVVIELKVGEGSHKACSQLQKYMGWVGRHLAEKRKVRGMVICGKATDSLKYAASTVPNVSIKEYQVNFSFRNADLESREG